MFNLIMGSVDIWTTGRETISIGRIFEYTDEHIINLFKQNDSLLLDQLTTRSYEHPNYRQCQYLGVQGTVQVIGQD